MKRFVAMAVVSLALGAAAQQAPPVGVTSGGLSRTVAAAHEVILDNLPQATAQELAAQPNVLRPLDGLTAAQRKARLAAGRQRPVPTGMPTGSATAAPGMDGGDGTLTTGTTHNFDGQQESCCTPSDMAVAVGGQVVQVVNVSITVLSKTGVVQTGYPKSLTSFFGLPGGTYVTDPRAFYDNANSRYVVIALTESAPSSNTNVGKLLLAVSQTSSATGAWWVYGAAIQIGNQGECPDYPTLGHDHVTWTNSSKGGIYVGINQFGGGSQACKDGYFIQNYVFNLPKNPIYAGNGFSAWYEYGFSANGTLVDTLQPSNQMNKADKARAEYLVNSLNINFGGGQCYDGCNGLWVWAISNPFGFISGGPSPEYSSSSVGTGFNYYLSFGADEPNGAGGVCSYCIETLDTRISGSVQYSAGHLYAAVETSASNGTVYEASPIWYILKPLLNDGNSRCSGAFANYCADMNGVSIEMEDCYFCGGWGGNGSAYFATLQPDAEGNVAMVFNWSNDGIYPGTAYAMRRVSQYLMHDAGGFIRAGQGYYGQGRWGDYTGTSFDASNGSMWFSGMYSLPNGNWGTRIGNAMFKTPNQP